jgi:hypothetical protein
MFDLQEALQQGLVQLNVLHQPQLAAAVDQTHTAPGALLLY